MVDKIEIKGYWFLPSEPDNRVAGTLYYFPNKKMVLELIGSFHDPHAYMAALANGDDKCKEVIWGESSDAKHITLLNCNTYGSLNFSCSFPMQKFTVQYCFQGIHLSNWTDEIFNKITVKLPYLTKWVNHYCVNYSIPFKNDRIHGFDLKFDRDDINEISVRLDNGFDLELEYTCSPPGTSHEEQLIIEQSYILNIISKNTESFWTLLKKTSKFKTFLTLGTLNTIGYQSIQFYSPDEFQELNNGEKIFHPIYVYFIQHDQEQANTSNKGFLFTHNFIENSFDSVIRKWFRFDAQMAPILKHLIESIKEKNIFNTGDFLIVVQALEGYATRFRSNIPKKGKRITLIERLEYLRKEFNYVQLIKNSSLDLAIVVNSRHYYSHFFNKKPNAHVADGAELFELTQGLKVILICCVLSDTGFDQNEIISIVKAYRDRT
jgi:hypothetical protein